MIDTITRSLTEKERRALRMRAASLEADARRTWRHHLLSATAVCGVLAVLTVLASDVPWYIIIGFWLGMALLMAAWNGFSDAAQRRRRVREVKGALQDAQVREIRIRATAVVAFEEEEDEGACYAFDVGDGTVLFVSGQEFYPTPTFPSSDFSLIHVHAASGRLIEFYIEKHGEPLQPVRTISAVEKKRLRIPPHLARVTAELSNLERVLAA